MTFFQEEISEIKWGRYLPIRQYEYNGRHFVLLKRKPRKNFRPENMDTPYRIKLFINELITGFGERIVGMGNNPKSIGSCMCFVPNVLIDGIDEVVLQVIQESPI